MQDGTQHSHHGMTVRSVMSVPMALLMFKRMTSSAAEMCMVQMSYSCLKEEVRLLQEPIASDSIAGAQLLTVVADQVRILGSAATSLQPCRQCDGYPTPSCLRLPAVSCVQDTARCIWAGILVQIPWKMPTVQIILAALHPGLHPDHQRRQQMDWMYCAFASQVHGCPAASRACPSYAGWPLHQEAARKPPPFSAQGCRSGQLP